MARKTFISYKYSESQGLRDRIIKAMGEDASYYQGETVDSPDQTGSKVETIKESLRDMIFNTSVTIVVISPNMINSNWIGWEIEYSLKEVIREGKASRPNGVVGVIAKHNGNYDWLVTFTENSDGCAASRSFTESKLYDIIKKNRFNKKEIEYSCEVCRTYDSLSSSYISLIEEHKFLDNYEKYIENAFAKSQSIEDFNIVKQR